MQLKMCTCLLLCLCFQLETTTAQSFLKPSLKQGPHKVGFKAGIHYDLGRPPRDGQFSRFNEGRAVHIGIWYPAEVKANHPLMTLSGYVDELSRMINPREITKRTRLESIHLMNIALTRAGGDSVVMLQHLADFLNAETHVYKNAANQEGEYPIIMYPESPVLNTVMAEYLASYGYIVVSTAEPVASGHVEPTTARDLETMVQDCQFTLSVVKREFNISGQVMAFMGTGINATVGLAWMMRNPTIEALINLEGGILDAADYELVQQSPFFNPNRVTKPILVMYSSPEYDGPHLINQYRYADRYILKMPHMRIGDYMNYGVWERWMPGILGVSGDAKPDFESMARHVLYFLDWKLKNGYHGRSFYENIPLSHGVPDENVTYTIINSMECPLAERDLVELINQQGFEAMLAQVNIFRQSDGSAIAWQTFEHIGNLLLEGASFEDGRRWAASFRQCYPDAVAAQLLTAQCYQQEGLRKDAAEMYLTALSSLPGDKYLLPKEKETTRNAIEARLAELTR